MRIYCVCMCQGNACGGRMTTSEVWSSAASFLFSKEYLLTLLTHHPIFVWGSILSPCLLPGYTFSLNFSLDLISQHEALWSLTLIGGLWTLRLWFSTRLLDILTHYSVERFSFFYLGFLHLHRALCFLYQIVCSFLLKSTLLNAFELSVVISGI